MDWCDPQILELLENKPLSCLQDEADDKEESDTENSNEEEPSEEDENSKDKIQPSNSTERLINEPEWFYRINSQAIVRGEGNLNYNMGNPVSYFGELMIVTVDFFDLSNATYYDSQTNQIIVD